MSRKTKRNLPANSPSPEQPAAAAHRNRRRSLIAGLAVLLVVAALAAYALRERSANPASADGAKAEIRLYDHLFARPDPGAGGDFFADLNPNSLETLTDAKVEPALAGANSGETVQFERQGYFARDRDSTPGRPVFNRTVGLRDSWAKAQASGGTEK